MFFSLGSETITWNEGAADPFSYLIYVHDYGTDAPGFDASEARISFYGESVVKMEAEDGNNEDRWIYCQLAFKLKYSKHIQCNLRA